jgi:hypothetical protein
MSKANDELSEETYGEPYGLSDILACYIDFGDTLIRISFTKNGEDYGQAFEFPKTDSSEFYPHILVKNVKFECNFGQLVSIEYFHILGKKTALFLRKIHGQKSNLNIH